MRYALLAIAILRAVAAVLLGVFLTLGAVGLILDVASGRSRLPVTVVLGGLALGLLLEGVALTAGHIAEQERRERAETYIGATREDGR
jgi:hypothetical protein